MLMPRRHTIQTSATTDQNGNKVYRFGFNGMESDFEMKIDTIDKVVFGKGGDDNKVIPHKK
jgi:hypothetical protein